MRKASKILSLLTAATLCFSATACGGSNSEDSVTNDGRRILNVEVLKAGIGEAPYRAVAAAFMEKHPDVLVKLNFNVNIISTTGARLESNNNVADVYSYRSLEAIKRWKINGWVEPIDDVYSSALSNGKTVSESVTGKTQEICTYNGEAIAIPEYTSIGGFVYNMSMFEQYGWEVPNTTKELEDLCKKIKADTNNTVAPIVYCGNAADGYLYTAEYNWDFQYSGIADLDKFYSYESAEVFAPENSQGKLLGTKAVEKFFFGDYVMTGSEGKDHIEAQTNVIAGEAAMIVTGSWFETEMKKILAEVPNVKLGMFAMPELSDDEGNVLHSDTYTTVDGKRVIQGDATSYWFVPSMAKNKDDAKEFLKFMSEPEACEIYTAASNNVRPFDYNKDPNSDTYKDMTSFGKSVLQISNDFYMYEPNATSNIAIKGLVGYWARGGWPFYNVRDGIETPEQVIEKDYDYAKKNWAKWLAQ